jgi:uncharacterized protein (TIGR02285 family)
MLHAHGDIGFGMPMKTRRLAAGCLISGLMTWTHAYADNITWLSADFPPLAMPGASDAQQGYMDKLLQHVQRALPQHRIQEDVLPWPRVLFTIQNGGPYCTAMAAQTPEREAYLRFTSPYGYVYPVGVVIRAQDRARFQRYLNRDGELLLQDLLGNDVLSAGVAGKRSYGTTLDAVLKPFLDKTAKQIRTVHQDNSTKSLLNMLQKKRFDYTLAYPAEVVYYDKKMVLLHFYPIAGNSDLQAGRFSCTKSLQTDRVFKDLSSLAAASRNSAALAEAYERWLPPYLLKSFRQRVAGQLAAPH